MRAPLALIGILAFSHPSIAFKAVILADTNRDGQAAIDDIGDSEALFLPNIGDTDRRCSKMISALPNISNEILESCHDASDNIQRSPQYMAPLITLPIPMIRASSYGSIRVSGDVARKNVRIFLKKGSKWEYIDENTKLSSEDIRYGMDLGIDARDTRRPQKWDGRATVTFEVEQRGVKSTSSVKLRVAPVITQHHLNKAQQVLASPMKHNPWFETFTNGLSASAKKAGIQTPLWQIDANDIWAQDFFEPGYASIPGPNGKPVSIRIMFRSSQPERPGGPSVFLQLRSAGVGAVQYFRNETSETTDSTGNVETIPPYEHAGNKFPVGRIIIGEQLDYVPAAVDYFRAQEIQKPLILKTDWLHVKHVDEFLSFIPTKSSRGWVLMHGDVETALELLRKAEGEGHGNVLISSRQKHNATAATNLTISDVLKSQEFLDYNANCSQHTRENLDILKAETGLQDSEMIAVPALYWKYRGSIGPRTIFNILSEERAAQRNLSMLSQLDVISNKAGSGSQIKKRDKEGNSAIALFPTAVNGVSLSNSLYLCPKPFGPVINGRDIFEESLQRIYGSVGSEVDFLDDYMYHILGGEIHCGTNTFRDHMDTWWKQ
ncbi:hypothetical protein LOZ61_001036 [Ophidiomyces ophidiicola]|nr:hypothetical protein LOZ61_001036 [Ophidiomyces ophidiicola]KAI1923818.1 hypothetical protein LOZ60_005031 [Ophidiomyces ophidiicola]KAI1958963.1 hypothetical protein LOZ59_003272 [Ophidiomyces ophidiicola]KAI2022522.1 hypothetical protein LOZ45_004367 [Ophidiomyces ophidiicola]KAI2147159.1 hypothetical protein LOZ27_002767 [Ophidiomyces ophidiicola]